ncbi:hypothetical protein EJB05_33407 [Eragrostis curvula]|uniref:Uncharacterized protein n=1 Tax=Eragrostis curvula TaxID=38414 RepID=A0A5J9U168_9POAL|nr:hypothetical protein EJB05_33407 [Eragrostis curvula]
MEELTDEEKATAAGFFEKEIKRELFMKFKNHNVRLIWLRKEIRCQLLHGGVGLSLATPGVVFSAPQSSRLMVGSASEVKQFSCSDPGFGPPNQRRACATPVSLPAPLPKTSHDTPRLGAFPGYLGSPAKGGRASPCRDAAGSSPSTQPLYTRPNPPSPSTVSGLKLRVAARSSPNVKMRRFGVSRIRPSRYAPASPPLVAHVLLFVDGLGDLLLRCPELTEASAGLGAAMGRALAAAAAVEKQEIDLMSNTI